jgi:hypothetical protein
MYINQGFNSKRPPQYKTSFRAFAKNILTNGANFAMFANF